MEAKSKKYGSVKRLGARYGRRIRHKLGYIESISKGPHQCPYCKYIKVKRIAVGIYVCQKCKVKFASRAYSPTQKKDVAAVKAESKVEEPAVDLVEEEEKDG